MYEIHSNFVPLTNTDDLFRETVLNHEDVLVLVGSDWQGTSQIEFNPDEMSPRKIWKDKLDLRRFSGSPAQCPGSSRQLKRRLPSCEASGNQVGGFLITCDAAS